MTRRICALAAAAAALAIASCGTAGHAAERSGTAPGGARSGTAPGGARSGTAPGGARSGTAPGGARSTTAPLSSLWGKAEQVPGLAALAGAGDSGLSALSCATPGSCSGGGFYQPGAQISRSEPFVVSQVHGTWTKAETVPGISGLNKGKAEITAMSCASPGNCSAGGSYTSGFFAGGHVAKTSDFVVSQINGVWGTARQIPGLAALNTGHQAGFSSISCASPGNCSAGGFFDLVSSPGCCKSRGFVVSEVRGAWGQARGVPGTAGIDAVSCATAGNCGAVGVLVLSQVKGVWGAARKVPTPKGSTFGAAKINVISCAGNGACSAGGIGGKQARALVATQRTGIWGTASEIAGTATLMPNSRSALVSTMSCTSAGTCTAGGYAFRSMPEGSSTREFAVPYLVRQRAGAWGRAQQIPGIGTLSKFGYATITALACTSPGDCTASGEYSTSSYNPEGSGPGQVFVVTESNGRWGTPADVTATLGNDGPAQTTGLSCPARDGCSAGGTYWSKQQQRAFVISEVR